VSRVMRPATEVLDASLTARQAIEKVRGAQLRVWPILDARGVVGVITLKILGKFAAEDDANSKLSDHLTPLNFPHLHSDQSLNLALERMSAAQLDVLPVVSRANIHELEGILTLQDVLDSYGFNSSARST
jgi:chloride channel protein, CIC family